VLAKIVFRLDVTKVRTLLKPNLKGAFALRVDPRKMRTGVHRMIVDVTFTRASGTKAKRLRLSFQRCTRKLASPRFTG
jgi:hypothetical protein